MSIVEFVEKVRELAGEDSHQTAQLMPPPSYLQALQFTQNDIVLLFKAHIKTSTSSLPLDVREDKDVSIDSNIELSGDPLPAPFAGDDDFEDSVVLEKKHHWPKAELTHFPLKLRDAPALLNTIQDCYQKAHIPADVWCLVDGGINQTSKEESVAPNGEKYNNSLNGQTLADVDLDGSECSSKLKCKEKNRILLGLHSTEGWWTRSFVESQGMCSIASPEMDPKLMKKSHLEIARGLEYKTKANISCLYSVSGQRITHDPSLTISACESASSVSLELQWEQLSTSVPLQEATTKLLVQVAVGHHSSQANGLWKQLCVLQTLFDILVASWGDKTTPDSLPHLDSSSVNGDVDKHERLKTLILGGGQALQAQTGNFVPTSMRQSLAPGPLGRQSMASGFLGRRSIAPQAMKELNEKDNKFVPLSLTEAVDLALTGNRNNADVTDQLWILLAECQTYRELKMAWESIFTELHEASLKPFIRPKNDTKAAKIIQAIASGQLDNAPDFLHIEGGLQSLELMIELGLEKLTADYRSIFLDSHLVGHDELQPPQIARYSLGVSRDRWLASCGQCLGWLAQIHTALEVLLPLPEALPSNSITFISSEAVKFYQSEASPVRSVAGLLSPGTFLQDFSVRLHTKEISNLLNEKFNLWRCTLTSESDRLKVKSVFLRSYHQPIFPPQLYDHTENLLMDIENVQYHTAEAITISQKLQ